MVEIRDADQAMLWVSRAQTAGLIPEDAGLRIDGGGDLVVDRHDGPGPWLRQPAREVAF